MKRFLIAVLIATVFCGLAYMMLSQVKFPSTQPVQALGAGMTLLPTSSPRPMDTPYPTMTPYPTVDYRATDQAYQLAMEQQRNDMIKAQLDHDEEMLAQQVELARLNATQTAAGTQVAMVNAQNTLTAGQLTLGAGMLTATAQAPTQMAAIFKIQDDAKHYNEQRIKENIAWALGMCGIVSLIVLTIRLPKYIQNNAPEPEEPEAPQVPEGLTPFIREERGGGDFGQWFVPCTKEQLTELAEMVVNGERNLAINRIETTSRTLRRPTLIHLRKFFRSNGFAIELGNGEIALNDRAVAFIEQWFENHELESGYQFASPPLVENI